MELGLQYARALMVLAASRSSQISSLFYLLLSSRRGKLKIWTNTRIKRHRIGVLKILQFIQYFVLKNKKYIYNNNRRKIKKKNKRRKQLILSYWAKHGPEMMKMLLTLNDHVQEDRKILLWLTSLKITKARWWGKLFKKVTKWLFDDCSIVPNEKKNKKIFLK